MKQEMSKKTYLRPHVKVVNLEQMEIICQSQFPSPQNEGYDEEEESVTSGWFNN